MYYVVIEKSADKSKKLKVTVSNENITKVFDIGDARYDDYLTYRERDQTLAEVRRDAYIARHAANEDWTESGIFTKGFWSYWMLWNGISRLPWGPDKIRIQIK